MCRRVLVVPDKFKGSLTAQEAADAITKGWLRARRDDDVQQLPMTDGGDGFGPVIGALLGGSEIVTTTIDAAHRPIRSTWWWNAQSQTAIIESALVIGLAQLPPGRFHPFQLDTYGLGKLLRAATRRGARQCIIGIGGSATNDAGFGMARALGWRFLDDHARPIREWWDLTRLSTVTSPVGRPNWPAITVAIDVDNPLIGLQGCSRVYGPQKGLRAEDFLLAERCLGQLAKVLKQTGARDLARVPGAGAAGGLGFGLIAFLGARRESGFELFARHGRLRARLAQSDLVITGEGAIDRQTLMGKGVGQVANWCRKRNLPCVGLAGHIVDEEAKKLFALVRGLTQITSKKNALGNPKRWLEQLAFEAACELKDL